MSNAKILLAEDDENLSYVIQDHLQQEQFTVIHASNGREALEQFQNHRFDLCIIDVMMPKLDGFSLAREIRKEDDFIPLLFLTAKAMEEDRIKGFEIGGDDYVTKPFSMEELVYRIRVFLRRRIDPAEGNQSRKLGRLEFDERNLHIRSEKAIVQLTQMEADLLRLLLENRNKLVKREDILVRIWGENDYFKGRSLDVFISRLRKYLKDDPTLEIRNHHGVGFSFVDSNLPG